MKGFMKVLRHYADFSGRARRKEYWSFVGFNIVVSFAVALLTMIAYRMITGEQSGERLMQTISSVSRLYLIALIIPSMAVAVRRLHDIGKSGWMLLVGLIPLAGAIWLLVLFATEGQAGDNQYGPDPKTHPETFGESVRLKSAGITVTVVTALLILLDILGFVIRQIEFSSNGMTVDTGSMLMSYIPYLVTSILTLCVGILLVNAKSIREATEQRKTVPILLLASVSIDFIVTTCSIFRMMPYIQEMGIVNFIHPVFGIFFCLSVIGFAVSLLLKNNIRVATASMAVLAVLMLLFTVFRTQINMPNTPDEALQWMLSHFYILSPVRFLVLAVAFYPRKENVGDVSFDEQSSIKNSDSCSQEQPEHGEKPVLRSFGKETKGQFTNCQRCFKSMLTKEAFSSELSKMGCKLDSGGNITASGAFSGYGSFQNVQQRLAKLEGDKAIQCNSCGNVYCVDCLSKYAPQHRTSGGKACFSCGGSLREL